MTICKTIYQTLHNLRNLHSEMTHHASEHSPEDIKHQFSHYAKQIKQIEQGLAVFIEQKEMNHYLQSELLYNNVYGRS